MGGIGEAIGSIFGVGEKEKGERGAGIEQRKYSRRGLEELSRNTGLAIDELRGLFDSETFQALREAGLRGGERSEGLSGRLYGELMAEPGMSPLSQFQLDTAQESIDKSLGGMGQYESGLRSELYKDAAVEISARDAGLKYDRMAGLAGREYGRLGTYAGLKGGVATGVAGLYEGLGVNRANIQTGMGQSSAEALRGEAGYRGERYGRIGGLVDNVAGQAAGAYGFYG